MKLIDTEVIPALARITAQDMNDRWTRAAVLTSVGHHSAELLHLLLASKNKNNEGMAAMLVELCRILGASETPEKLSLLLGEVTASTNEDDASWQEAGGHWHGRWHSEPRPRADRSIRFDDPDRRRFPRRPTTHA